MDIRENAFYKIEPHIGDSIINILLRFAIVCLLLTFGAVVRAVLLRYCIINYQVSVTDGWIQYDNDEITKMIKISRETIGLLDDIVVTLRDKIRLELRAVSDFCKAYYYKL